jgi:hypothetical protein
MSLYRDKNYIKIVELDDEMYNSVGHLIAEIIDTIFGYIYTNIYICKYIYASYMQWTTEL